jgi:hypothetical protein
MFPCPRSFPPSTGQWVDTQRVQYKKMLKKIAQMQHDKHLDDNASGGSTLGSATPLVGRLTQDRIHRLQNLGFVWSLRDDWAKHYEELKGTLIVSMLISTFRSSYRSDFFSSTRVQGDPRTLQCTCSLYPKSETWNLGVGTTPTLQNVATQRTAGSNGRRPAGLAQ